MPAVPGRGTLAGMGILRSIWAGLAELMTPDSTLVRVRFQVSLDQLLTLAIVLMALGLSLGYQVLRHLPRSWREALLGDPAAQD